MFPSARHLPLLVFATTVALAGTAWAIGFELGESKEELGLKYDVSVTDHDTGRVTVTLKITDTGRLKPLASVKLVIPAEEKNRSGSYYSDLSVSLAMKSGEEKGTRIGRVHLLKQWAERAELQLITEQLGGRKDLTAFCYHSIPIADYFKDVDEKSP